MMIKLLTRRKAVSSMIGGIIILTLFLSALSMMVFISQQYDTYQSTVETMNHKDIDAFSENLAVPYPGLEGPLSTTTGNCNQPACWQYSLLVNNEAAIGTQAVRLYINSTSGPCVNLCIFAGATTPTASTFLSNSSFINPSEGGHQIIFYLANYPSASNSTSYELPTASLSNSITIVTSRGRAFSTQYPPAPLGVTALDYLVTNAMKIAYQPSATGGYDSKNEGNGVNQYCHKEKPIPLSGSGVPGGSLSLVNPWMTSPIFDGKQPPSGAFPYDNSANSTILYIAINATYPTYTPNNNIISNTTFTITGGNIWLQAIIPNPNNQGQCPPNCINGNGVLLYLGGSLIGLYYIPSSTYYTAGSSPQIPAGKPFVLIYRITSYNWGAGSGSWLGPFSDVTFTGLASVTNKMEDGSYTGATIPFDGLYVRFSC